MVNEINLKIEHVLILAIIAFVLYHLISRCECANGVDGFSVGSRNDNNSESPESNCQVKKGVPERYKEKGCSTFSAGSCRNTPNICYWKPDEEQDKCISKINVADHPSIKEHKNKPTCKNLRENPEKCNLWMTDNGEFNYSGSGVCIDNEYNLELKCNDYYQINEEDSTKKNMCIEDIHDELISTVAPCKASDYICNPCPELNPTESPYEQMKKCYSSKNPKCKFEYNVTRFNKCIIDNEPLMWGCWEPSHRGHTWNTAVPTAPSGAGWKGLSQLQQKEVCELYGNNRDLNCSLTAGALGNECIYKGSCILNPSWLYPGEGAAAYKESCKKETDQHKCELMQGRAVVPGGGGGMQWVDHLCFWNENLKNKWFGEAPLCNGECDSYFPNLITYDNWGDGEPCITGAKALCSKEKSKNIWCGKAPFCDGVCPKGCKTIEKDDHGDGDKCYTGNKVLCDCTDNPNATCP